MISLMSRQGGGIGYWRNCDPQCMRQLSQGSIGIVDVDTSGYATAQPTRWSNDLGILGQKVKQESVWSVVS